MRKHFLLLMLTALLPLASWAVSRPAAGPANGTAVGATVKIHTSVQDQDGLVTYRVTDWDETNGYYKVQITGLDATGLDVLAGLNEGETFDLQIPVSFNEKFGEAFYNYAVDQIDDQAFYGFTMIKSLVFVDKPAGATAVAVALDKFDYQVGGKPFGAATPYVAVGQTFYGCTSLETLTFTENCRSIGEYSFQNTAISTFEIPKQCATIAPYAFWNCQELKTVTVATGNTALTELSDYVFANSAVEQLDLTQATKLTTIGTPGNSPFLYNLSIVNDVLKKVWLPATVRDINDSFAKCTALTNIYNLEYTALGAAASGTLPAGTHIINGAFNGCRSLTRLDLPNCDVIASPFVGCIALDTLTFVGNYDKTIYTGGVANYNLFGANNSTLPNYVAADQSALKVVEFKGAFLGTIADDAFVGTLALDSVAFDGELQQNAYIGAAFKDVTSLRYVAFNGIQHTNVAASTITIAANAFKNTGISTLNFGRTLLQPSTAGASFTIEKNAFSDCANLTDVQFGFVKTSNRAGSFVIEGDAFINNPKLAKVTFGSTHTGTPSGNYAAVFQADGTIKIYDNAFAEGNTKLTEVEFANVSTGNCVGSIFIGADANTDLVAPVVADDATAPYAKNVFGDGEHLQKVTFGNLNTGMFISSRSFASTDLREVKFGDIQAYKATLPASTGFMIGVGAFEGGNTADKTVEFGNISDKSNGALGFAVLQDAFAAKMLKSVKFGDFTASNVSISNNAFANANKADYDTNLEAKLATQNLQRVELGNINAGILSDTQFGIFEGAFWGGKTGDKKVKIGTIKDNTSSNKTLNITFFDNAFAGENLDSVGIGDMAATQITIKYNAFANKKYNVADPVTQNLKTVKLGNITSGKAASTLVVEPTAFWGGNVAAKSVTIGTILDGTTAGKTLTVNIGQDAFVAEKLDSVKIDNMKASTITIGQNAFANVLNAAASATAINDLTAAQGLRTVTLGNIEASGLGNSTFTVADYAFWGGNTEDKIVKIGKIANTAATPADNELTATFGEYAFQAANLKEVTVGNMTAQALTVGTYAFSGKKLDKVVLGDTDTKTASVVYDYAFANLNNTEEMTENVTIGKLKAVDIRINAFKGPQFDGSTLNVTIDNICGTPTIAGSAFIAPVKGKANYTVLGDVDAGSTANIVTTAFEGSKDVATPAKNTTNVKIQGDYEADFATNTFTNVDTVWVAVAADNAAKSYAVTGDLGAFGDAKVAFVGDIPTTKSIAANTANTNDIEEIYFLGGVADKAAINTFNSTNIRKIDFVNVKNQNVKVAAEAVAAAAFAAAATACIDNPGTPTAAVKKNISVVYKESQTAEAKNIFEKNIATPATSQAFGNVDDVQPVTLYTTTWTKANIYESTAANLNWKVNRLGFSASEVVPGDNIEVAVRKGENMTYAYGKLFIPKGIGMKYKISAEATGSLSESVNTVQVYYGRIDKQRNAIYQHSLPTIDGYYWINATEKDQAFMVRTKDMADNTIIKAVPVTAEEDALFEFDTTGDYVYFDNANNINQYRYNTQVISNQNLKNDAEFHDKEVYTLANPTKGFAFAWINKNSTDAQVNYLRAKSLYIVGNILPSNGHVNVIFDDEDENSETTGIENVNVENNNDAIYNLQGVRVNGDAKGVFIQNGKKYVVK